jgi:Predicted P-loop ATPase and inactivated derivatives
MGAGKYGPDNRMNAIYAEIVSLCERHGFPTVNLDGYLTAIASENRVNPVLRWIRGKEWDGVDRLEALGETLSLDAWFPPELKKLLVRRWLVSAVAAASSENFKSRGVLVLQGPQGIGKTSWFQSLVPAGSEWFLDGVALDPEDKDSLKKVISHWIIELGELEATFKKADINKLKSYITSGVDVVRLPWARKMSTFPRRTVFCASVNQAEFLVDTTGNSRWWVLPCTRIQYRHSVDVQQVWAQALDLFQRGEPWWLNAEEEAELERITQTFEAGDEVSDLILSKYNWEQFMPEGGVGMEWMNATNALIACGVRMPTKAQVRRAGEVLRKLTGEPRRMGTHRDRCYLLPPLKSNTYYV